MKKNKYFKYYFFCDEMNNEIINKIHKMKNIVFVLNINDKDTNDLNNKLSIVQFLRRKKIQFLLYNNFQKCIKYQANGVFLDSKNKSILRPMLLKKKFSVIGAAHNQLEYIYKSKQSCQEVMLSPIFENSKYSPNKILNVIKKRNTKKEENFNGKNNKQAKQNYLKEHLMHFKQKILFLILKMLFCTLLKK